MYYTGNFIHKGVVNKNLNILRATKKKGVWGNIEYLPLNNEKYKNGQAVLNANETALYFVSDRDSDIFVSALHKDGSLGVPKKLGKNVNTLKKEISPYLTKNNELYFSSKGHGGFGGLDIFYVDLNDKNAKAINLGKAINSAAEDFTFSMNPKTGKGFICSNREGSINIYEATQKQDISKLIKKAKEEYLKKIQEEMYQVTIIHNKISSPVKIGFQSETADLNKEGKEFLAYLINYFNKNPETFLDVNSLLAIHEISGQLANSRISAVVAQVEKKSHYTGYSRIQSKIIEIEIQIDSTNYTDTAIVASKVIEIENKKERKNYKNDPIVASENIEIEIQIDSTNYIDEAIVASENKKDSIHYTDFTIVEPENEEIKSKNINKPIAIIILLIFLAIILRKVVKKF